LQDVIKGAPPGVSPQERYITNPATGKSICSEHWGDDEEEAEAEFCEHVCRSLGLEQHEITFFATDGEEVTVNTPVPRPSN
jgi:hypothetical protein